MTVVLLLEIILALATAVMFGIAIYTYQNRNTNYIVERLKKGYVSKKQDTKGFLDDILETLKPLTEANMKGNKNKDAIKQMFVTLGMSASEMDIMDFENRRMLKLIIVAIISGIISMFFMVLLEPSPMKPIEGIVMFCLPTLVVYRSPQWKLQRKIKQKEKAFDKYFPDAIDLLCVCVEAGLSIDSAIERVGREFSNFSYDVGYEFNRVAKDMLSGVSKQDALKGLADRIKSADIQSFVAIIIQADKMGASIANSLAISADSLRTKRKQRLEAQVASASTKMTIPLVLCLLPATFAVLLTPAAIQLVDSLGKMNGFK